MLLTQERPETGTSDEERSSFSFHGPLTLDDANDHIFQDDEGKWDAVLPRTSIEMRGGRLYFPDAVAYGHEDGLRLSPWATGQVCSRLGIPAMYFKKCPPRLQDAQFNCWAGHKPNSQSYLSKNNLGATFLSEESNAFDPDCDLNRWDNESPAITRNTDDEPYGFSNGNGHADAHWQNAIDTSDGMPEFWLLRSREDRLRAVLTDKYTPLDNRTLMECLMRALPARLEVKWIWLDDESFHLRIIDPAARRELFKGDDLFAGLHICNSEVGKRSVTLDTLAYRLVCSNGLIGLVKNKSILSQRHMAVSPSHFVALLRQGIAQALATANLFIERMAWATGEPLGDVEEEVNRLSKSWQLSQSFADQVKSSLLQEDNSQQETVYGLINAFTNAAQKQDADKRYEIEILAGKFLEQRAKSSQRSVSSYVRTNGNGYSVSSSNQQPAVVAAQHIFGAAAINQEHHDEVKP